MQKTHNIKEGDLMLREDGEYGRVTSVGTSIYTVKINGEPFDYFYSGKPLFGGLGKVGIHRKLEEDEDPEYFL